MMTDPVRYVGRVSIKMIDRETGKIAVQETYAVDYTTGNTRLDKKAIVRKCLNIAASTMTVIDDKYGTVHQ